MYGDDTPGCSLGVYRAGEIVYAKGYGLADIERRVPITTSTVFDLGSTSKQITAAALMLLVQDGTLSLDDDVRRHVPELPSYGPAITVRHLLQHTSGLRDYITLLTLAGYSTDDVTRDEDALAIITRQRAPNFAPGSDQLYSNSGFFLVSVIVERAAGMPLREFARTRIFAPLGLTRTHVLHRTSDLVRDRAQAYGSREDGTLGLDLSRWEQTGDGAVWTTIEELARWDANFYTGQVGGQALLDALQTPGRLSDGRPLPMPYGLGLMLGTYRDQPTVRHGGSWSGFRAELLRFPAQRTSVAVLCNVASSRPATLAERVADVVLAREFAGAPVPAPAPASAASGRAAPPVAAVTIDATTLPDFAGRFHSDELDATYTVVAQGEGLAMRRRGPALTLTAAGTDQFRAGGLTARFTRDTSSRVTGFTLDAGRVKGLTFTRVP